MDDKRPAYEICLKKPCVIACIYYNHVNLNPAFKYAWMLQIPAYDMFKKAFCYCVTYYLQPCKLKLSLSICMDDKKTGLR